MEGGFVHGSHPVFSRHRLAVLIVALSASAAIFGAPAHVGAATTIGSDLSSDPTLVNNFCAEGCTLSQRELPGRQVTAPTDGVIVRWRIRVGNDSVSQPVTLRVVRRTGTVGTGIASSEPAVVPGTASINTFATRLPILAGDFIGIDTGNGGRFSRSMVSGAALDAWRPPLADGETRAPTFTGIPDELMVNADVEPDADNDAFGDETQDQCPGVPGPVDGCPKAERTLTLDANKGKVEKKKKVRLSGQLEATGNDPACEAGQSVRISRTGLKGGSPVPVTTVQTDAQGNFATKLKVKKSSLYTATTDETAGCESETSDTEKVRVQKPKAAKEA